MGVLTETKDNSDEGNSNRPAEDASPKKSMDDSSGTAATVLNFCTEEEMIQTQTTPHPHNGYGEFLNLVGERSITSPVAIMDEALVIYEDDADLPQCPIEHVKEIQFHNHIIRDSIQVQSHHKANDDELHEENPHLQDYLVPHHSVQVETPEETKATYQESTTKKELCTQGILHQSKVSQEQAKARRKVHFGEVLVRDYAMTLGDHPCCSYGPPITIDWAYLEYEPLGVNEYEFHHPPRRSMREMLLNYYQRKALLSNAGFSETDFKQVKKLVNREKTNRSITRSIVSHYPLLKVEDAVESACRKFKRLIKEDHWKQQKSQFVK